MISLPLPRTLTSHPAHHALVALLDSVLLTSEELAAHWRYSPEYLSNLRRRPNGPPYVKLATGSIRYRMSDVIDWEIAGARGPVTIEAVALAMDAAPGLTDAQRVAVVDHLRVAVFDPRRDGRP